MGHVKMNGWRKLPVSLSELCINTTLRCGQSFRWRKSADDEWSCAMHGRILTLRQDSTHLHYKATFPSNHSSTNAPPTPPPSSPGSVASSVAEPARVDSGGDDTEQLVRHYFNLDLNLTRLYEQWSAADANFRRRAPKFTGIRILKQDAWEALVGFICSSNNNIARISQMVDKLCRTYGPLIGHIGSEAYHDFPHASALTDPGVEQHLRTLGFGYRAKYLWQTAVMVAEERESGWLESLRNPESPELGFAARPAGKLEEGGRQGYRDAHEALLELQGVGPKVADCVCLMGLGWGEAVPVDTHVWQIAQRDYKFGKGKHSSLTKATYDAVGNCFRKLWGKEAGWAHSVLFTADLRTFSDRLTKKVETADAVLQVEVKEENLEAPPADEAVVERKVVTRKEKKKPDTKADVDVSVKREREDIDIQDAGAGVGAGGEDMMSRVKRRRRQPPR